MTTPITSLRLFNLQGGYQDITPRTIPSRISTPSTEFGDSMTFDVNRASSISDVLSRSNVGLNPFNNSLNSSSTNFSDVISASDSIIQNAGNLGGGVSSRYNPFLNSLTISDKNNNLFNLDHFTIPGTSISVRVDTDGNGGVANVGLDALSRQIQFGQFVGNDSGIFNTRSVASVQEEDIQPARSVLNKTAPNAPIDLDEIDPSTLFQPRLTETRLPELTTNLTSLFSSKTGLDDGENPLLAALLRRQPLDIGVRVVGSESQISPDQALRLATALSDYNVRPSDAFKRDIAMLKEGLALNAHQPSNAQLTKLVDGRIPVTPYLPSEAPITSHAFQAGSTSNFDSLNANVSEKKGSGGYVPFRMSSNDMAGGNSDQQNQRRRQPSRLSAMA